MMNNQVASQNYKQKQEDNPLQALATQFQMTEEETSYIVNIVQENDPSLELLKQPRVLMLIKQRKGRWVKVGGFSISSGVWHLPLTKSAHVSYILLLVW